jgi:hypothetical protein
MERTVYYFEKPGKENTDACVKAAMDAVAQSGYAHIVVATTGGETGLKFARAFQDLGRGLGQVLSKSGGPVNVVCVTHSHGFKEPNVSEISPDMAREIIQCGARLYTGTMITHSLETALAAKFSGVYPALLVAQTLRRFGEGVKVCCEITMMAADAGLIPEGGEALAVAGTGRGADTVCVMRPAVSKRFLELKVLEILAKPG